jgi:hypothetical protein
MRKVILTTILSLCTSLLSFPAFGRVLDDFNDNNKTGWEDFTFGPGYASITEANGQLNFSLLPVGQSIFAGTTKTSEALELKEGRTIEFRADLVSGNGPDAFAILSFIPTGSDISTLSGYGFAKSSTDILISKGINKYFYDESPALPIKNDNVTMVLSLTVRNGSVIVTAKVLDKDANDAVIFEQTFTDTTNADVLSDGSDDPPAPYLGSGHFALLCYEDEGTTQASYEVTLDNAEVFVTDAVVLDDFNDNVKTGWEDFTFGPDYASITEANGQFNFSLLPVGQPIFAGSTKTSRTFDLIEGERVQFSVDLVSGNGPDSFAVLAFIPTGSDPSSLSGYGLTKSSTDILISKGINKYFYDENPDIPIKNDNVTLVLTLTARNGSVEINAKVLDKDDNDHVIFEQTFIDTPQEDILSDGTDDPAAPYLGSGNFVLFCYEDDGTTQASYEITLDNAIAAAAPVQGNAAPVISSITPSAYANFLPPSTALTFKVADDQPVDPASINVVLNGLTLTSGSGLTITGSGNSLNVSAGALADQTDYKAVLNVTDAEGLSATSTLYFDTFSTNTTVIEAEDYNFNSGSFLDSPVVLSEGFFGDPTSYNGQFGEPDVDYHDTRTDYQDAPYRPTDHVRMQHSLDLPRQKFIDAGGSANLVYDYDIGDIAPGEWLNYTHTFEPGNYEVYLRESLVNGAQAKAELWDVGNGQTNVLGTFILTTTGYQYRNIPLTDAVGQTRNNTTLSGQEELRLVQIDGDPADGNIYQNYLVFVPFSGDAVRRPTITSLTPAAGSATETVSPEIDATIQNRDTTLNVSSIKLYLNGELVTPIVTPNAQGATIHYSLSPLPPPGSTLTGRIEFEDNEDVIQTNEWSFTITYKSLDVANRQTGAGAERGLNLHFVQATFDVQPLDNTLARAESQLAANSTIPKAAETNTVVQGVNFSDTGFDAGQILGDTLVPGLEPDLNGADDFAVEVTAYLDLSAGVHRFGVDTDDGYKISAGASLTDRNASPLAFYNGGPANETFDFVVPAAGLYPFRFVWYDRGGGAHAEWFSVDPASGDKTLINDPENSASVKAYISLNAPILIVLSSATVSGGYAPDSSAVIDLANKRITIPVPAANRFYRLQGSATSKILGTQITGASLVLTLQ